MTMFRNAALALALATGPFAVTGASAATLVIDVSGAEGWGDFDDPNNTVATYLLGAGAHITGLSYNVNITANAPSWLSEAVFGFGNATNPGFLSLAPGAADDNPGTADYSNAFDLVGLGLDFFLDAYGRLYTQFFEAFTDGEAPDSVWNSGTITITYDAANAAVPEPATWAMMMIGFGLVGGAMRRRPTVRVRYAA